MNTAERLEFLATLPNELRPVTCELKTKIARMKALFKRTIRKSRLYRKR